MSISLLPMSACDALWALMPKQLMPTLLQCLLAMMQDGTAPIAFGLLLLDVVVVLGMLFALDDFRIRRWWLSHWVVVMMIGRAWAHRAPR